MARDKYFDTLGSKRGPVIKSKSMLVSQHFLFDIIFEIFINVFEIVTTILFKYEYEILSYKCSLLHSFKHQQYYITWATKCSFCLTLFP